MDPLGDEIRDELRRLGGESGAGDIGTVWVDAVGPDIAANAWPARTQADGTLVVHVRDAIWGFELTQQREEIGARLPGRPTLKFVPGPLPDRPVEAAVPKAPEATPEQEREAAELTAGIEDRNLRESVSKAIKASLVRASDDRSI